LLCIFTAETRCERSRAMIKKAGWRKYLDGVPTHPLVRENKLPAILDTGKERQIRRFLDGVPYESVLDIGCGTGTWSRFARGRYLGIDASPVAVARAEYRHGEDPLKQFVQADAAEFHLPVRYDLTLMISVLHCLSDEAVESILEWVARTSSYVFILDLYPIHWNPVSRWLYTLDGGSYIRTPQEQEQLLSSHPGLKLIKKDSYYCPNGLYRHTLFLYDSRGGE
jgi:SAM-dependent methyltransferase